MKPIATLESISDSAPVERARMETDDLYPERAAVSRELDTALRLLKEATTSAEEAVRAFEQHEEVKADDAFQRLQMLLPELFCCRKLSDGFAAVVNAVMCAFENLEGLPPTAKQATGILDAIRSIRMTPFTGAEQAAAIVERLEEADLAVEPPAFKYLADWLDDAQ